MPVIRRRDFLAGTSLSAAAAVLGTQRLAAQPGATQLATRVPTLVHPAAWWLPEPITTADLQHFAAAAVDAARQAGASYADVRVGEQHHVRVSILMGGSEPQTQLGATFTYGVRVLVDGAWGFVHGTVPSTDALARSAQAAVDMARGYAPVMRQRVELMPAPVATGTWSMPVHLDPFEVPLQDQAALLSAYCQAIGRVHHGLVPIVSSFYWTRERRAFCSSEGSAVTQTLYRSRPYVSVAAGVDETGWPTLLDVPHFGNASGGYEAVAIPNLQEEIKQVTEEAARLALLPRGKIDVGRYPLVMDGGSLGACLGQSLGPALELDRVLGYEAGAGGTSFLNPPAEMLNTAVASPLLTVHGHRSPPSITAAKWDDEGVEPRDFPIITGGQLVNYVSTRETATLLHALPGRQNGAADGAVIPGCARAMEAGDPVVARPPHFVVTPGTSSMSLDDLCKNVSRGVLVRSASSFMMDRQLTSGLVASAGTCYEIAHGKVVRRLEGNAVLLSTRRLWRSLIGVGDATTVRPSTFDLAKGQPWRYAWQSATAPAGLFKEADVISTWIRL